MLQWSVLPYSDSLTLDIFITPEEHGYVGVRKSKGWTFKHYNHNETPKPLASGWMHFPDVLKRRLWNTFFRSSFIPPLHQQVARTLGEEGQHTQLQQCRQCEEGKQVNPGGLLQSKHQQKICVKASDVEQLHHITQWCCTKQMHDQSRYITLHWIWQMHFAPLTSARWLWLLFKLQM